MTGEDELNWQRQHHEDMGGLDARLTAAERGIDDLGKRFDTHARAVDGRFDGLQQTILSSNNDLSRQIAAANVTFAASGRTNWGNIFAGVSVLVAIGGILAGALGIRLGENTSDIKDLERSSVDKKEQHETQVNTDNWLVRLSERELYDERNAVKLETISGIIKQIDRLEQRVDTIDAQLVKRPEILSALEALGGRIDSQGHRADQTEADFRNLNPLARVFEDYSNQLRDLRLLIAPLLRAESSRENAAPH